LVNPVTDPISGEPEFKHTPVRVTPYIVAWQGFVLSRKALVIRDATAWSLTPISECFRYELAGRRVFGNWSPWARRMLEAGPVDADWIEYVDRSIGIYRAALLVNDRIDACVFLSPRPDLPSRTWLAGLFAKPALETNDRIALLLGKPFDAGADAGETVCSCFNVGRNTISACIQRARLKTTDDVGRHLRAGTNCGSCLPELRAMLKADRLVDAQSPTLESAAMVQ
jgi:assimilatory nitrate reductase catalytic subunit